MPITILNGHLYVISPSYVQARIHPEDCTNGLDGEQQQRLHHWLHEVHSHNMRSCRWHCRDHAIASNMHHAVDTPKDHEQEHSAAGTCS